MKLKKYKIGIAVFWLVSAGLIAWSIRLELIKQHDYALEARMVKVSTDINNYVRDKHELPDSLDKIDTKDIEGVTYTKEELSYKLCGNFKTVKPGKVTNNFESSLYYISAHPKGSYCATVSSKMADQAYNRLNSGSSQNIEATVSESSSKAELCGSVATSSTGASNFVIVTTNVASFNVTGRTFSYYETTTSSTGKVTKTKLVSVKIDDNAKIYDNNCQIATQLNAIGSSRIKFVTAKTNSTSQQTTALIQLQ